MALGLRIGGGESRLTNREEGERGMVAYKNPLRINLQYVMTSRDIDGRIILGSGV